MDTLVRVGRGSYSDYIRPFEADATGIIVPHVASDAEARQIVDWVRSRFPDVDPNGGSLLLSLRRRQG